MSVECPQHREWSASTIDNPHDRASSATTDDEPPDWRRAHEELSRLAKSRSRLDWDEARWLVMALRSAAHLALGFATFAEYIERLFGYKPRWTSERLRVAEALEDLPELNQALKDGALNWSAIRELTRVAVPETERQWLGVTKGRGLREIEELVSGHHLGDAPGEPSARSSSRHVLRFDFDGHACTGAIAFPGRCLRPLRPCSRVSTCS